MKLSMKSRLLKSLLISCEIACFALCYVNPAFAAEIKDIKGNWAYDQIKSWQNNELISGYPDGTFKPNENISRAQFIKMVNNVFGFEDTISINFKDVKKTDWFYTDIAKAKKAKYLTGYSDGTIRPNAKITRQEVASIIANVLKLDTSKKQDVLKAVSDSNNIPEANKGYISAVIAGKYMSVYSDKSFKPLKEVTRAEALTALDRTITYYNKPGTYGSEENSQKIVGNVIVSAPGVTIQNVKISGGLLISNGVGDGDVFLKNVTVKGTASIKGGGEHSDHFTDAKLGTVYVNKPGVRIVTDGSTTLNQLILQSSSSVEQQSTKGDGIGNLILRNMPSNSTVSLMGKFLNVSTNSPVKINIANGSIKSFSVKYSEVNTDETAINLGNNSYIGDLSADAKLSVTGKGKIGFAKIGVNDVIMETSPEKLAIANGIEAMIEGKKQNQSFDNSIIAASTPSPVPTATSTPAATSTPTATSTPAATSTPTATPAPTVTPAPTATPVPTPTATPSQIIIVANDRVVTDNSSVPSSINTISGASLSFSSDNTDVATVDSATGIITGVSEGTASIKVSASKSGYSSSSASFKVNVIGYNVEASYKGAITSDFSLQGLSQAYSYELYAGGIQIGTRTASNAKIRALGIIFSDLSDIRLKVYSGLNDANLSEFNLVNGAKTHTGSFNQYGITGTWIAEPVFVNSAVYQFNVSPAFQNYDDSSRAKYYALYAGSQQIGSVKAIGDSLQTVGLVFSDPSKLTIKFYSDSQELMQIGESIKCGK